MFKFIGVENKELTFEKTINEVSSLTSPIKEIINKEDLSDFSFSLDEEPLSFENTFHFQVNVRNIGSFHFLIYRDDFNKKEVINNVLPLKEMEVTNYDEAIDKTQRLLGVMKPHKPLFIIFTFSNDSYLSLEKMSKDVKTDIYFFYVKQKEQSEVKEISIGSEGAHNEEYAVKKDDKNVSPFKKKTKAVTKELVDNKFHFLLLMVSTILFESSIPLAILNIQTSNLLYIFLFICSGIGIAMNFYAYWDYFKKGTLKQTFFYSSVTINALSILMGIGIFCLFYNISTKAENGLGLGMLILIGAAICISICLATILITYFVQTARRKKIKYNE